MLLGYWRAQKQRFDCKLINFVVYCGGRHDGQLSPSSSHMQLISDNSLTAIIICFETLSFCDKNIAHVRVGE